MVTFDLGFDKKKNKPEAINIHKARMLTHDIRCGFLKRTVLEVVDFLWFSVGLCFFWGGLEGRGPLVQRWCCAGEDALYQRDPKEYTILYIFIINIHDRPEKHLITIWFDVCSLQVGLFNYPEWDDITQLTLFWKNEHQLHHHFLLQCCRCPKRPINGESTDTVVGSSSSTWIPVMGFTEIASSFRTVDHGWGGSSQHMWIWCYVLNIIE